MSSSVAKTDMPFPDVHTLAAAPVPSDRLPACLPSPREGNKKLVSHLRSSHFLVWAPYWSLLARLPGRSSRALGHLPSHPGSACIPLGCAAAHGDAGPVSAALITVQSRRAEDVEKRRSHRRPRAPVTVMWD